MLDMFKTPCTDMKGKIQSLALHSLSRVPPTSEEAAELHTFFLTYGQAEISEPKERVWMGDTRIEKTMLIFPQERKCIFFNLPVYGWIKEFYDVYTVSIKRYSVVI